MTRAERYPVLRSERWTGIKESRMEDYLFIGGPRMTARAAAERLGISWRTVERYKRELRERGLLT